MQTFVPSRGFARSASQLDRQRLGKQRIETLQILDSLANGTGYKNHPVNDMWRGYEDALVLYGLATVNEWRIERKMLDNTWGKLAWWMKELNVHEDGTSAITPPPWVGNIWVHRSHRSNLIRKDPGFYLPIFGDATPKNMPYLWPVIDSANPTRYRVFLSKADLPRLFIDAVDWRTIPTGLEWDPDTREVFPAGDIEWPMA